MQTYLIVGGAGYIGSHAVKTLLEKNQNVLVLDNLMKGHRQAITGGVFFEGDLGDPELLHDIFTHHTVDCVMHFAAFSLVGESVQKPLMYYRNNVARTANLLSAMEEHGVRRFIFSSTAAVYGEPDAIPIREDALTAPTNPYGRTKLCVEQMLRDCDEAFGLKTICLRYFNAAGADPSGTIGEDHSPETHLIPIVLQVALGQREHIKIFGTDWDTPDGTCIRDYVHVKDLADAHVLAADKLRDGGASGAYNLGCQTGYSVKEIIEIARKVTGHPIPTVEAPRRAGDPARLIATSEKIQSELGWQPRFNDPETMIATAWNWHKHHPDGY